MNPDVAPYGMSLDFSLSPKTQKNERRLTDNSVPFYTDYYYMKLKK
jgi:hypothetical protein